MRPLDAAAVPPGSGGMLAALAVWRRLLLAGPERLGRTTYWGRAPRDPWAIDPSGGDLVDVLETATAGIEARFFLDDEGRLIGIDLWTAPAADPCEIRVRAPLADDSRLPGRLDVSRGGEPFATFLIERLER